MEKNKYSMKEKELCMNLFISGNSYKTIIEMTGITKATLNRWNRKYGWNEKKEAEIAKISNKAAKGMDGIKQKAAKEIEEIVKDIIDNIPVSKLPTRDKLIGSYAQLKKIYLGMYGISSEKAEVETKANVKLEDLL